MVDHEKSPGVSKTPKNPLTVSELSGIVSGLFAALPVSFLGIVAQAFFLKGSVAFSLAVTCLGALAGVATSLFVNWSNVPAFQAKGWGARFGARAGFFSFLCAAATSILTSKILQLLGSHSAPPSELIFLSLLMAIPVIAAGSLLCVVTTSLKFLRSRDTSVTPEAFEEEPPKRKGLLPYLLAFLALACLSLFIPADLFQSKESEPELPPIVEEQSEAALPLVEAAAEPVFEYVPPEDLDELDPTAWTLSQSKVIAELNPNGPTVFSPNSQLLACSNHNDSGQVQIHDLSNFTLQGSFQFPAEVEHLAFASDSNRLFCITNGEERLAWIIDLSENKRIQLPIPEDVRIPSGPPVWQEPMLVQFRNLALPAELDLETLRARRSQEALPDPDNNIIAKNSQVALTISTRIGPYLHPHFLQPDWEINGGPSLVISSLERQLMQHLPAARIDKNNRFLASPDLLKILHLNDDSALLHYVGKREATPLAAKVPFKHRDLLSSHDEYGPLFEKKTLCAFVCEPLVNPLTNKVVGPDRKQVKGLVRLSKSSATEATFVISESYRSIADDDIIADLHFYSSGQIVLLEGDEFADWWAACEVETGTTELPTDESPTQEYLEVQLQPEAYGVAFTGIMMKDKGNAALMRALRAFVRQHHLNISNKDLNAHSNDYASRVDYFDFGYVSRSKVAEDQAAYQAKFPVLSERVTGRIEITPQGYNNYRLDYPLELSGSSTEGERLFRNARVTLDVTLESGNPKIVRERSRVISNPEPETESE